MSTAVDREYSYRKGGSYLNGTIIETGGKAFI
jgi:hypothetical protein